MESVAVSVQNVSKKFRLFNSPKERLLEVLHPFKKKYHREFWALTDINLEVEKGTTVGIIGRNGSGKSTLLQIICSILRPTSGIVTTNSRISSLLTLGAGFSPEFTGRDNVLMNGALMGFSTEEMKQRLPVIEAFADIGEFIDQPVKIYSSGMFVRLAFATAINVDPDILIIDEVLAVGDAKFQHKCFQKFLEFQESGKTILFVSHNINAVIRHCDYAVLLEKGRIIEQGEPKTIANYYTDLLFTGKVSGYASLPNLLERDFKGFNIVHYKNKYYGLLQSLGAIDFTNLDEADLDRHVADGKCVIGSSFEQTKQLIDKLTSEGKQDTNSCVDVPDKTALDEFLEEVPDYDNCINRNSYNKNEYRQKSGKAEIIDYLVVSGDDIEPTTVRSGQMVDIYIKARFNDDVEFPLFGFSVKTIDGVLIYALNSFFTDVSVAGAKRSDVIIFKFSVKLGLPPGDFFVDLGVDQQRGQIDRQWVGRECAYDSLDRRCAVIHLFVQEKKWFHGLADFEAGCQEVVRNGQVIGDHVGISS